jgi:hypothetical protein
VGNQDGGGRGQLDPPPGPLGEPHADLALQRGELLGDGLAAAVLQGIFHTAQKPLLGRYTGFAVDGPVGFRGGLGGPRGV